jgi:hypothetical protein
LPTYPAANAPDFVYSVPSLDFTYTEPATGDHSVLFSVYNQPRLYDWLFAHATVVPEPATTMLVLLCIAPLAGTYRPRRMFSCHREKKKKFADTSERIENGGVYGA